MSHIQLPCMVINMQDGGGGHSKQQKTRKVCKNSIFLKMVGSISRHIGSHE